MNVCQANFDRLNDADPTATGALVGGAGSNARISYAAAWFDGIDRSIAAANYGAISSFARPDTPPSSSSTVLVTGTTYDQASRVYNTTDANGIITQPTYDNASRTIEIVEDVGGLNRTTKWTFTLDNQIAALTAVNPITGDQTTRYSFGTTLANSGVARNDLLGAVYYPTAPVTWPVLGVDDWANLSVDDWANLGVSSSNTVGYTYNALGEQATITDQRGTVRTLVRDKLGRQTNDCVTTVGSDTDDTVLQIATAFETRGMPQLITSLDNATPGGTVLNQVQLTYNSFSQLALEHQEHTGTVTTGSVSVGYAYDDGSNNEIRLNELTYPNGRAIGYSFGTTGGMNDYLNRIETIQDTTSGTTDLAGYTYLGLGTVVRITYPEPGIWLDLWGGTSGTFAGLDQFNRIIDQCWQNNITSTPADIDRYKYGYDQNSNRLWKANIVGTAAVGNLDEGYAYDTLNRLTQMQRGTLSGGTITGTPTVQQNRSLDATGNWSTFATAASGSATLNQNRTQDTVNEITGINQSTGPTWVVPAYDPAGNTTTMPQVTDPTQSFTAVYDAWNQMASLVDVDGTVGTYTYDGRNRRMVKTTSSETRHFYWTDSWQDIEERVATATTMDKQYVWGVRYVDDLACRDDASPERLYGCQDATFDLTAVVDEAGDIAERYLYIPYGTRTVLDETFDPVVASAYSFCVAHQSLYQDFDTGIIYNRSRSYHCSLGRFISRDILFAYADGPNLYAYEINNPLNLVDPSGRWVWPWDPSASWNPVDTINLWLTPGGASSGPQPRHGAIVPWEDGGIGYVEGSASIQIISSTGSFDPQLSLSGNASLIAAAGTSNVKIKVLTVEGSVDAGIKGISAEAAANLVKIDIETPCVCVRGLWLKFIFHLNILHADADAGFGYKPKTGWGFEGGATASAIDVSGTVQARVGQYGGEGGLEVILGGVGGGAKLYFDPSGKRIKGAGAEYRGAATVGVGYHFKVLSGDELPCP